MIGPIDPTGRSDRFATRKLIRLLVLLTGVFVVGAGIGWLVGQISAPSDNGASQKVATTLPQSLPDATASRTVDALAPPQPAPIAPADQRAVTSVITQAAQQPPVTPPPGTVITNPAASSKPQQLVVIEPPPEPPAALPAETASATPATASPPSMRASRKRDASRARHAKRRNNPAVVRVAVTVVGAKSAAAGARWIVQLGAFKTHDHAALLVLTLQSHGAAAQIVRRNEGARGLWYVVETPSVASLSAARETARRIAAREHLTAFVEPLGG